LQCVAVCCSSLQCVAASVDVSVATRDAYTATHCNTLQHTTTHCNTLQHSATLCNTLQHTATHRNTLQHTATPRNTPQHTATHRNTLQHVSAAIRDMRPHSQQHPSRTLHLSAGRGRLGRKAGGGADAGPEAGASHGVSLGVSPESRSLNESASEPPMLGNLSRDAVLGHCNTLQPTATQFSSLQSLDAVLGHSLYASVGSIESLKAPPLTVCASLSPLSLSCMHVCGAACK